MWTTFRVSRRIHDKICAEAASATLAPLAMKSTMLSFAEREA
jgi:hypothetical protein